MEAIKLKRSCCNLIFCTLWHHLSKVRTLELNVNCWTLFIRHFLLQGTSYHSVPSRATLYTCKTTCSGKGKYLMAISRLFIRCYNIFLKLVIERTRKNKNINQKATITTTTTRKQNNLRFSRNFFFFFTFFTIENALKSSKTVFGSVPYVVSVLL